MRQILSQLDIFAAETVATKQEDDRREWPCAGWSCDRRQHDAHTGGRDVDPVHVQRLGLAGASAFDTTGSVPTPLTRDWAGCGVTGTAISASSIPVQERLARTLNFMTVCRRHKSASIGLQTDLATNRPTPA